MMTQDKRTFTTRALIKEGIWFSFKIAPEPFAKFIEKIGHRKLYLIGLI